MFLASDKVAILVVNCEYKTKRVFGARKSIVDFKMALENLGFHVISLLNVTKKEYKNALEMFSNLIRKGVYVLFYNNGHGQEKKGNLMLRAIEDEMDTTEKQHIVLDDVMDYLKGNHPELICMILDNCRSG